MDILKLSTEWAKAEVFSAKIVWIFSIIEILAAVGFFYFGKTGMAKAFFWPLLIMGLFLVAVGAGLYFTNNPRVEQFEKQYQNDSATFVQSEIQRTTKSKGEMVNVLRILPAIILVMAIMLLLMSAPIWRAIAVSIAINAAFLMIVDSNTEARNNSYNSQLITSTK
jgi:ABC-2 type transport system permease protein